MTYAYDPQNVFAKILRGEIPCKKAHETAHSLAFHDIRPQAPTHVLVIPKRACVNADDFAMQASEAEIADFYRCVAETARLLGVSEPGGGQGYRLIANSGPESHQEVPHYHIHILAGRPLGPMLAPQR